jgi:hypothetical protein
MGKEKHWAENRFPEYIIFACLLYQGEIMEMAKRNLFIISLDSPY